MIIFIEVSSDGKIHNSGIASVSEIALIGKVNAVNTIIEVSAVSPYGTGYWDGIQVVSIPKSPTDFHEFNYLSKQWVLNADVAWLNVTQQRKRLLDTSDWIVIKAQEEGSTVPPLWSVYRQALRDITEQADPLNISWPTSPA